MRTKAEKELLATEEMLEEKAVEAEDILKTADGEDRDPSEKEMEQVTEIQQDIKNLRERRKDLEALVGVQEEVRARGKGMSVEDTKTVEVVREPPKTLGEMFTESKGYKDLMEKGLSGEYNTGPIELLTKSTLSTTPGTALTPAQYLPGIIPKLYQAPTVADLLPKGQVSGPVLRYVEEGTGGTAGSGITNAAAAVAELGAKPESALAFEEVQENVRKIATLLPVSDEMLEDVAQIQSYINNRLSLFIQLEQDRQLVNGSAANEVTGFLNRTGILTYPRGTVDNQAVGIFKAANGTRGSSFLNPNAIVMHPTDWQTTRLLTDTAGQFFGGGPFTGEYSNAEGMTSPNRFNAASLWGLEVVVTSAIGQGTALLGAFNQAAQLFTREGITVEASNSHSTYFANNITAIRAEMREALAVFRPGAFCKVTGL